MIFILDIDHRSDLFGNISNNIRNHYGFDNINNYSIFIVWLKKIIKSFQLIFVNFLQFCFVKS